MKMTDGTYNVLFRLCVRLSAAVVFCQFGGGSFLFFTIVTDYVVQYFFMVGITSPESIAVFIAQAGSAVPPAEIVINRDGLFCIPRGGLFANDVSLQHFAEFAIAEIIGFAVIGENQRVLLFILFKQAVGDRGSFGVCILTMVTPQISSFLLIARSASFSYSSLMPWHTRSRRRTRAISSGAAPISIMPGI